MTNTQVITGEKADILAGLGKARHFLRFTVRDLTDEQAAQRPTASELCLGGLIKHVTATEGQWAAFILGGAPATPADDEASIAAWVNQFQMAPGESLAEILARY